MPALDPAWWYREDGPTTAASVNAAFPTPAGALPRTVERPARLPPDSPASAPDRRELIVRPDRAVTAPLPAPAIPPPTATFGTAHTRTATLAPWTGRDRYRSGVRRNRNRGIPPRRAGHRARCTRPHCRDRSSSRECLAGGADQDLLVAPDAALPRAVPPDRVTAVCHSDSRPWSCPSPSPGPTAPSPFGECLLYSPCHAPRGEG